MASDSTLRQRQRELTQLRHDLSKATSEAAAARVKASKATAAAGSARSESTVRQRLSEAAREEKKANAAEVRRGQIEKKIADKEKSVFESQRRYEADVERERKQAFAQMTASIAQRESQFHPSLGRAGGSFQPSVSPSLLDGVTGKDVFISHASEDKDEVARPLASALEVRGVTVWIDELSIAWGQPIRRAIEQGIANCTYGLVIISPSFMRKHWTQAELDALYGRQMGQADGHGVILPLWHRVTADDVQRELPMVAGLKALNTAVSSVESIADDLADLVRSSRQARP